MLLALLFAALGPLASAATAVDTPRVAQAGAPTPDAAAPGAGGKASQAPAAADTPASDTAPAQPRPPAVSTQLDPLLGPVRRIGTLLDELEKTVERVKDREDELSKVRIDIDQLPGEARSAIDAITPRLADVRSQIEKLGPAPKSGEPAEAEQIASERARLNAVQSELDGAIKSAELASERARQLAGRVQDLRQAIFTSQLLRRTQDSPLKPVLWRTVAQELPNAVADTQSIIANWWRAAERYRTQLAIIFVLALVAYSGLRLGRRFIVAKLLTPVDKPPTFFARAVAAGWLSIAIALPSAAAAAILYAGLDNLGLLYLQVAGIAEALLTAVLIYVAVTALSRAIMQPSRPLWRLFNLSDRTAQRLHHITGAVAAVYAADLVLAQFVKSLYLPFQVNVALAFVFSILFAILMLLLARTRLEPRAIAVAEPIVAAAAASPAMPAPVAAAPVAGAPEISVWHPWWLKVPLVFIALAIAAASLLGYVALGRYISAQVVLSGTVIVVIMLLHLAVRAISGQAGLDEDSLSTRLLGERFKLDDTQRSMLDGFIFVALNVALALLAAPLLLYSWGFSTPEVTGWLSSAIFGFQVGGFQISLARILIAVLLFAGLIFATRILQRWMQSTVLRPAHLDAGLANSIHTGVGYAGFGLAALTAISYSGFDITNIALVAGALSVGIGFGLQSIVNNFVSGLILLVERPIKVGDWIHAGTHEGYVRRISVRSTEIETFDRSSVIIPNSELITGSVRNRTHRNTIGRITVPVGVAYSADPEQVRDLLVKAAQDCDALLRFPAPIVLFTSFGASSLDFTVHGFVSDVNKSGAAGTELRIAIFNALRNANIEVPFPQTDVHLRDLDLVKALVQRVAEERLRERAQPVGGGADTSGGDAAPKT